MAQNNAKVNAFQVVTDRIVDLMEQGILPWSQPWHGSRNKAISHSTGRAYSLLNQFLLGRPGEYATFNQVKAAGGHVKKGAKSSVVVFWKQVKVTDTDPDTGDETEKLVPMLRYYRVFNLDDCEGIAPKYYTPEAEPEHLDPIAEAEDVIAGYVDRSGVEFTARISDKAYYSPSLDCVVVPELDQYDEPAEYYSTAFHELTHSTGHVSRLNRFATGKAAAFGGTEYSKEELTAELGAAYLMNHVGIGNDKTERNSAAYLQSWIKVLRNDPKMIVYAAARAEKAVNLILGEA